MTTWDVRLSEEFESWIDSLPEEHQDAIYSDMKLLQAEGPSLGRPRVDSIEGSRMIRNLKELRTRVGDSHYRSFFAFDPDRRACFLVGGDKSPSFKSDKARRAWYDKMIRESEIVWQRVSESE